MRRLGWCRSAPLSLCAVLGLVSVPAPPEEPIGVTITEIDSSAFPTVSIEVGASASLVGTDVADVAIELSENGRSVPVTVTAVPTSGLEVVLLVDVSGSMREGDALGAAKDAAIGFLEDLPAAVPVGIVSFGDAVSLVSPLSTDRGQLEASIRGLTASGETAMYDAVVFAQLVFSGGTDDRQMVVLSDGGDTVSAASLDDAVAVATVIRTSVIELVSSEANRDALTGIAAAGNGTMSSAEDPLALDALYGAVATSLVNRFRLDFVSLADGVANYRVRVVTPAGEFEATATEALPAAEVVDTTAVPTTSQDTVPSTTPPVTTVGQAPPAGEGDGSAGAGQADQVSPSGDRWLWLGAATMFAAASILLLGVFDRGERVGVDRHRLASHTTTTSTSGSVGVGERVTGAMEQLLERGGRRTALATKLEYAGLALRPGEFVVLVVCATLAGALVLSTLFDVWGFIAGLALGLVMPRTYLSSKTDQRRRAFVEQLPDVLQLMVSSLRSGYGLPQALDAAANQTDDPARSEFQRIQFEIRIGRDPGDALAASAQRMQSREFDWVVAAMAINREIGGELAHVLDNLAETVRDRQRLQRQIRTLTAEGRLSAYVLTALPILLAVLMALLSPGYFEPFRSAPGPLLIGIGVVLMTTGWIWMRRLIRAQM